MRGCQVAVCVQLSLQQYVYNILYVCACVRLSGGAEGCAGGLDSINSILATCSDVSEGRFPVTDKLMFSHTCSVCKHAPKAC